MRASGSEMLMDSGEPLAANAARRRGRRWPIAVAAAIVLAAGGWFGREQWADWHERSARQALAGEDFDGALRHIERALQVHSDRPSTNLLAARIQRERGAYREADDYIHRAKDLGGTTESLQLEWSLLRCETGAVDEVAPGLLAAADRNHAEAAAILESLARIYIRQARYPEALAVLDKWVARDPDSPRALDWRGWVNNQFDRRDQAMADYAKALELQPGRSLVRLRLAQVLIKSLRFPEALPHLERLRTELPADPEVKVGLAACYAVQLRTDEARRLLDEVLAVSPNDFTALRLRGKVEREAGQYAEAERWLTRALEQKPLDPDARYSLYQTLADQPERKNDAERERLRWEREREITVRLAVLLRTELIARPHDPDLAAEAGELLLMVGEDQRGLYWLNKALAMNPGHRRSHRALAAYYQRMNNPALAEEHRRLAAK